MIDGYFTLKSSNMKILILKSNYDSFEQYYLNELKKLYPNTYVPYTSNSKLRKFWTHYGVPFENIWYGNWKVKIADFELVIVFDSFDTPKMLQFIREHSDARIVLWHWNPIRTQRDIMILNCTRDICEHWTFDKNDSKKYNMKLNNQFFFFQDKIRSRVNNSAFFIGADKGRYKQLEEIANFLKIKEINVDFHMVSSCNKGEYYQKNFIEYDVVLNKVLNSQYLVEIVQDGQDGLTVRALEAMFMGTKLITNNQSIKECAFYNSNNIFVLNDCDNNRDFFSSDFQRVDRKALFPYSAQGWIENFCVRV